VHGWESNRRSGVALAMHHRHSGIPIYRLNGLGKGDEHPAYWSTTLEYYNIFKRDGVFAMQWEL